MQIFHLALKILGCWISFWGSIIVHSFNLVAAAGGQKLLWVCTLKNFLFFGLLFRCHHLLILFGWCRHGGPIRIGLLRSRRCAVDFHLFLLNLVLGSQLAVVLHVLLVDLLYNFVQVITLEPIHVVLKVFLLLLRKSAFELVNCQLLKFLLFIQQLEEFLLFLAFKVQFICLLHIVNPLSETRIPIVLDGIVSSAHESFGDQRPLFLLLIAEDEEDPLFLYWPLGSFDFGVKMIEPAFSARFSTSTVQILLKISPHHTVFVAVLLVNVLQNLLILGWGPVADRIGGRFLQVTHGCLALPRHCLVFHEWLFLKF